MSSLHIRIKRNLQLLLQDTHFDFIKTLDEGVKLPDQPFSRALIELLSMESREDHILTRMSEKANVSPSVVSQFLDEMIKAGILERFDPASKGVLERYDRQLLFFDALQPLPVFEENFARQKQLSAAHVAIIGVGGIGNFIALSLAASGIGRITLVDADHVEESNLSRQILFSKADLGQPKVAAAARRLRESNDACSIDTYVAMIDSREKLQDLVEKISAVDYLVLSADQAIGLPRWAASLRKEYGFKAIKCGYMGYQGLIGPIIGPATPAFDELLHSWVDLIECQPEMVVKHHENHTAASSCASNAILANIAALEIIKDLSGAGNVNLMSQRLLFNLKTLEMRWG